ncbi:uncharacterized protein LOC135839455 [Planococcus citri]|uniref:uncharacterized protein LOC135839455 n=1 Tax=Planococcus citri TaxID=170843 RepID=UPI0031F8753B
METELKPWSCEHCTYMNEPTWLVCGMCYRECTQTNTNGMAIDFPVIDPEDLVGLDAGPEYAQPTVAAVSAAAVAVSSNASKVFIQAAPAATVATSSAYIPYTTAYPVSTANSVPFNPTYANNIIPSTPNNVAEVKPTTFRDVGISTSANLVANGAKVFTTVRKLVPVTVSVTQTNAKVPRVRVINPKSNPSYFNSNGAFAVTSTATSVPVSNANNLNSYTLNSDSQVPPLPRTQVTRPVPTYNANVSTRSFTMPVFTPTTAGFHCNSINNSGVQVVRSSRTETPLTFPSYAGASTVTAHASSTPVASGFYAPCNSGAQSSSANSLPFAPQQPVINSATPSFQLGLPNTPINVASVTNTYVSGPGIPPVTSTATFNGAARLTTAAFAAALATEITPGWVCSSCKSINDNFLLRCKDCDTKKPETLPNVQPTPDLYFNPNNNPNVVNDAFFECPQCFLLFAQSEGMILEHCGHKFCKNCLREWISYSADLQLRCPFKIKGVLCNSLLTYQEVSSILNSEYVAIDDTKVITARSGQQNGIPDPPQQNIIPGPAQPTVGQVLQVSNVVADPFQQNTIAVNRFQANIVPVSFPQNIVQHPPQQNIAAGPSQTNICPVSLAQSLVPGSFQHNIAAGPPQTNICPVSLAQTLVPGSFQHNIAATPLQTNNISVSNLVPGSFLQTAVPIQANIRTKLPAPAQNIIPAAPRPKQPVNLGLIDLCSDSEDETNVAAPIPPVTVARNPPAKIIGNEINYQELLELENEVLIPNLEVFECTICMTEQNPGEGVVMRDCLHMFCRDCLKQAIKCNTDAEMRCLYGDGKNRCDSTLQDREIRALVDAADFEKHLSRSIKEAENKIQNTFHCKTVDCVGWCEYEEEVTEFGCPVCSQTNCINCKAIHTGMDCKQYQINIQLNSAKNPEDAKTNKMLQTMLKKGTAMNCPKCAIILSKVTGCDWLRCSMCKTEICWVTRGPRWGPKGHGDTSGGCRCRLNGKYCHPKCGNCH